MKTLKVIFGLLVIIWSHNATAQKGMLQLEVNDGVSIPAGSYSELTSFASFGFNYGAQVDYYFTNKLGLAFSYNRIMNDASYDFKQYLTDRLFIYKPVVGSHKWANNYFALGPIYKIGSGRFNIDIFGKVGLGSVSYPSLEYKLDYDFDNDPVVFSYKGKSSPTMHTMWETGVRVNYKISRRLGIHAKWQYISSYLISKGIQSDLTYNNLKDVNNNKIIDLEEYQSSSKIQTSLENNYTVVLMSFGLTYAIQKGEDETVLPKEVLFADKLPKVDTVDAVANVDNTSKPAENIEQPKIDGVAVTETPANNTETPKIDDVAVTETPESTAKPAETIEKPAVTIADKSKDVVVAGKENADISHVDNKDTKKVEDPFFNQYLDEKDKKGNEFSEKERETQETVDNAGKTVVEQTPVDVVTETGKKVETVIEKPATTVPPTTETAPVVVVVEKPSTTAKPTEEVNQIPTQIEKTELPAVVTAPEVITKPIEELAPITSGNEVVVGAPTTTTPATNEKPHVETKTTVPTTTEIASTNTTAGSNSSKIQSYFTVQIIALTKENKKVNKRVKDKLEIEYFADQSMYRYLVGKFATEEEAVAEMEKYRSLGFGDAFIAQYENNVRVITTHHLSPEQMEEFKPTGAINTTIKS